MLRRGIGVGSSIAGRTLEAEIGRGGMGIVYKARNERLDRTEAVKVITDDLARDKSFRERFLREAMISVAVEHPHVIPVYDADEGSGGHLFIAMRYVEDGNNMARMISQRGQLDPRLAANLISAIASALDAAHARDLVHRDVKPTNVLIVGDRAPHAYLTDFGLSKRLSSHTGLSGTGSIIGTVDYMSPEQAQGLEVDLRTDVYALGVALFEALTGTVPYPYETSASRLLAKIQEPPPMVTQVATGIPSEFDAVIAKALARDPNERFASAGELGRAAQAAAGRPSEISTKKEIGIGSVVADCLIESVAGEGGMAIVYKAVQQNLGRTVALKVMSSGLADQSEFRVRFEREWKVAAALDHPSVVPILWAGEAHGRLFIVMRYVEGETLRERLAHSGRLEPDVAVEVLEQVCAAVGAAHERGLVHRDIKPGNVLIEEATGRVFLTDFGLAKPVDDDITDPGSKVMGTVRYMAPERHHGDGANEVLGDIYALGCVLWDMVGGIDRPRLETIPDLPPAMAQVVAKAVAPDPQQRFGSAVELAQAARAALDGPLPPPPPPGAAAVEPQPSSVVKVQRRAPFEPAPLSSGLTDRIEALCKSVLAMDLVEGEAREQLEEVRVRLVAPLDLAVVGRADSGRTQLINALIGRRLTPPGRGYGDVAPQISFVYGIPEKVIATAADGTVSERSLSPDGTLPSEVLDPSSPLASLQVQLPVDSLRTVSLSIGASTADVPDGADAFLLAVAADAISDVPTLLRDLSQGAGGRGASAINAGIVVTKADLTGTEVMEAGLDATVERALQPLIADADRVNAQLAEIAGTDVSVAEDVALIAELARSSGGTRADLLASSEAFKAGASMLSEDEAEHLLGRYGLEGLRAAFELADSGQLTGVGLRRRLREVSGMSALELKIDGFHRRSDALKAGRALERLDELSYRWPELEILRDHVEAVQLEPEMHLIDLMEAYTRCVLEGVDVPKDLLDRLEHLIVGRTEAERFGVGPGAGEDEIRAAKLDGFRAWKVFEQSSSASPAARRVARRVTRSYEHYAREGESATR